MSTTVLTPIPNSYTELRKGIKTAQALYESDYNDQYVYNALREKGFDHRQTIWCMRSAEVENVEHRKKTSRLGVIIFGGAWAIIFTLLYVTADVPAATAHIQNYSIIPVRYWIIAGAVFIGSVVNYIYAAAQVARVKKKLPADPSGIGENEPL